MRSRETVGALTAEQMRTYHRERYAAGNIVLAVAGRVEWSEVVALAEQHCGAWPAGKPDPGAWRYARTEASAETALACFPRGMEYQAWHWH